MDLRKCLNEFHGRQKLAEAQSSQFQGLTVLCFGELTLEVTCIPTIWSNRKGTHCQFGGEGGAEGPAVAHWCALGLVAGGNLLAQGPDWGSLFFN